MIVIDDMALGDRMKAYERSADAVGKLNQTLPGMIRVDGRTFSTYTKFFDKPFDMHLAGAMQHTAVILAGEIQNAKLAFGQSDEITIVMSCESEETQMWFKGKVQKIVSSAASIATEAFNEYMDQNYWPTKDRRRLRARFDARTFNLPYVEVCNNFIWRQRDAIKNSKQQLGRSMFSQREMQNKNTDEIVEMLEVRGTKWSDLPLYLQRGFCVFKEHYVERGGNRWRWKLDTDIPVFGNDRPFINSKIFYNEE